MITLTNPEQARSEIVRGMPVEDYNKATGLRQSLLKTYMERHEGCPALYLDRFHHPSSYDSPAFIEGRAFHTMLLEPKSFDANYRILTDSIREQIFQNALSQAQAAKSRAGYTKIGSWMEWKEKDGGKGFTALKAYKDWVSTEPTRNVITFEDKIKMEAMIGSLRNNPDVMSEFEGVTLDDFEVSLFAPYKFKEGGMMQLKCRVDIVGVGDVLLDLKTCRTTNPRRFASDCAKFGYDVQAAFYMFISNELGMKKRRFGFVAIEKDRPYLCCVHYLPESWIKYARILFRHALAEIKESIRTNHWPNPVSGEVEPPSYLSQEIEALI